MRKSAVFSPQFLVPLPRLLQMIFGEHDAQI
jgi:hypothetical protein